jgi:hypothetical protein
MKTIYWKTIKRKFKNGGVVYARRIFQKEERYYPDPVSNYDLSWLENVEVSIQLLGDSLGSHWINEIYLMPTKTEADLCGFRDSLVPMRTEWDYKVK